MHAWKSHRQPSIVTHDLWDDQNDPVLKHLRHKGLFNAGDDPVKMVFHPEFVTATSPLIHLDYPQFVRGCNLGIFPSYYEPWGYTPMECLALGVPAVTTDLSGFGAYVQRHIANSTEHGVLVLNRRTRSFEESAEDLTNYLFDFVRMSRRTRIELRNRTERLSEHFDWSVLVRHYHEAHDLAMQRVALRSMNAHVALEPVADGRYQLVLSGELSVDPATVRNGGCRCASAPSGRRPRRVPVPCRPARAWSSGCRP